MLNPAPCQRILDELQRPEPLTLAPVRPKVVRRYTDEPRAPQRFTFGALDVHLQEADPVDRVLHTEIVEPDRLHRIQFLLGHESVQTTERYIGCKQRLRNAVNDRIGLEPDDSKSE